jgi:hypothetical protein
MQKRLTYLPFDNQTIEMKMTEVDYRDEYQLTKWELFSPERIDSIFQFGKQVGEMTLKYDELGRLISNSWAPICSGYNTLRPRLQITYFRNALYPVFDTMITFHFWNKTERSHDTSKMPFFRPRNIPAEIDFTLNMIKI